MRYDTPKLGMGLALFWAWVIEFVLLNPVIWIMGLLAYIGFAK